VLHRSACLPSPFATITVPEGYVDRFRREAVFSLADVADQIEEAADWMQKGNALSGETEPRTVTADELDKFDNVRLVYSQVTGIGARTAAPPAGDLTIEANPKTLASAAEGCALAVADEFLNEAQSIGGDTAAAVEEFDFWRGLRDEPRPRVRGEVAMSSQAKIGMLRSTCPRNSPNTCRSWRRRTGGTSRPSFAVLCASTSWPRSVGSERGPDGHRYRGAVAGVPMYRKTAGSRLCVRLSAARVATSFSITLRRRAWCTVAVAVMRSRRGRKTVVGTMANGLLTNKR